jgi:hypothetical protein
MNCDARADDLISRVFLESIHPTGQPKCISWLGRELRDGAPGSADVVVLAPTSTECRKRGWIEKMISFALHQLAPEGLIYVLAPRLWRAKIGRLLRRHGLATGVPTIHLEGGAARYYVPLTAGAFRYATMIWPLPRRWRMFSRMVNTIPIGAQPLAWALPHIGFVAAKPGSTPFEWLLSRLPGEGGGHAIVATSWRGPESPTLLFALAPNAPEPGLVVKRGPPASDMPWLREASLLEQLGETAGQAGMRVPAVVDNEYAAGKGWLMETAVPGRPACRVLDGCPSELPNLLSSITRWLVRWHQVTIQSVELTDEQCEREIFAPADILGGLLGGCEQYFQSVRLAARNLIGTRIPLVAAHCDLTMANVLTDARAGLGLVDWEEARPLGLPMADFWYGACDAVAAIDEYQDRVGAFRNCFEPGGAHRATVEPLEKQLRAAVGGPQAWIDLCFHACWLQHAANEHIRGGSARGRPFLSIVRALSLQDRSWTGSLSPPNRLT